MEKDMTKGSPLPVILQFTLPLIIGNIFQQLYNMADTIIVGRYVGADALAAVGSTGTIMFLVLGFAQGITAGFTVLTSQRFGAKDTSGVKRSVANGILLALLFTIVLTFFSMISMRPLLHLMNTPENIFQDAYTYIMIICGGLIATIFYNLLSSYLRAVGNSQTPLMFLIFSLHAGYVAGKTPLEASCGRFPPSALDGHSDGTPVCHHRIRYNDYAGCH